MTRPTLYLMLGYPGSGKTTIAKMIHELTGAVHLWADHIRRERLGKPTYSHKENLTLYQHMNQLTGELLAAGNSVIFDTNFNFYKDREHLRQIARAHGAETKLIWVKTSKAVAKDRATYNAHQHDTRILGEMSSDDFERISQNLQEPKAGESYVSIDGTKLDPQAIKHLLA